MKPCCLLPIIQQFEYALRFTHYAFYNVNNCQTSGEELWLPFKMSVISGIGHFDTSMATLEESGFLPALGICLGMHMLRGSEESPRPGLGWIAGETKRFVLPLNPGQRPLRIPHMGWNNVSIKQASPLVENHPGNTRFYFAHSYYVTADSPEHIAATIWYG